MAVAGSVVATNLHLHRDEVDLMKIDGEVMKLFGHSDHMKFNFRCPSPTSE